jgi:hypothetical protein
LHRSRKYQTPSGIPEKAEVRVEAPGNFGTRYAMNSDAIINSAKKTKNLMITERSKNVNSVQSAEITTAYI